MSCDEVDDAAERVGPEQWRGIRFRHLYRTDIAREVPGQIDVAVEGQIRGNPVDIQRDLTAVEAANRDPRLIPRGLVIDRHARQVLDRLVDGQRLPIPDIDLIDGVRQR